MTQTQWWHAYGREAPEYGAFMVLIAGPTDKSPDDLSSKGIPFREMTVDTAPYLGSFNHEPSALEKDRLQPEEFRELDDSGNPLEPTLVVTRTAESGVKLTTHHPMISDEEY